MTGKAVSSHSAHFEPVTLWSALSQVTERIGFVATASTKRGDPKTLERVPIKWNHLIDKDAAQNQRVGACPHETSDISDV